jgi:ER membrane protein complex subunit 7
LCQSILAVICIYWLFDQNVLVCAVEETISVDSTAVSAQGELFTIFGKVNIRHDELDLENTRILIDDGQYVGFLRSDGTFSISGLPSNSYVLEISSSRNVYEPVRVDINSKGKVRSRRLNLIQPTDVTILRYPLHFESKGYPSYFFKREQFRVLDVLLSPMVLMMIVPLLLVLVLPKIVNQDPELQRELQQTTNMLQPNQNMPNMSEIMYNMFDSGTNKKPKNKKSNKKE